MTYFILMRNIDCIFFLLLAASVGSRNVSCGPQLVLVLYGSQSGASGTFFGRLCRLHFIFFWRCRAHRGQERVHEELDDLFAESDRYCTQHDLVELKYLDWCIKEALRLYPSVPFFDRLVTQPLQLGNFTKCPRVREAVKWPTAGHVTQADQWRISVSSDGWSTFRWISDTCRLQHPHIHLRRAPQSALLSASGRLQSAPVHPGAQRGAPSVRLHSVRCWTSQLHRTALRSDGDEDRPVDHPAPLQVRIAAARGAETQIVGRNGPQTSRRHPFDDFRPQMKSCVFDVWLFWLINVSVARWRARTALHWLALHPLERAKSAKRFFPWRRKFSSSRWRQVADNDDPIWSTSEMARW